MMPSLARLACLALAVAGAAALPMSARKKHTLAETFKSIESDIAALERASASRRAAPVGLERMDTEAESLTEILVNLLKDPDSTFATKLNELVGNLKEQEPGFEALEALNKKLVNVIDEKATEKRKAEEEKRKAEAEQIEEKMARMLASKPLVPRERTLREVNELAYAVLKESGEQLDNSQKRFVWRKYRDIDEQIADTIVHWPGLEWDPIDCEEAKKSGRDLAKTYPQLVSEVAKKSDVKFTWADWDAFKITDLKPDDWITTSASEPKCFKPQYHNKAEKLDTALKDGRDLAKRYPQLVTATSLTFKNAVQNHADTSTGKWTLSGQYHFVDTKKPETETRDYEWGQGRTDAEKETLSDAEQGWRSSDELSITLESLKKRCRSWGADPKDKDGNRIFEADGRTPKPPECKAFATEWDDSEISTRTIDDAQLARLCDFYSIKCDSD